MANNAYIIQRNQKLGTQVVNMLNKRYFEAYYAKNKKEALEKAIELLPTKGESISWGGSMSIIEIGLLDHVLKNNYNVINREKAATPEERNELLRKAMTCDTFLMGSNALSERGELVNIDCMGNRTAALMFGPKNVIIIVGINKVMPSLDDAIKRARNVAAPTNMQRVAGNGIRQTPCFGIGSCSDCNSTDSICSHIVITRLCNPPKRIKVILTGETLGF